MHATTPAEDMTVRTTMSEDHGYERGRLFRPVSARGAIRPSVHATTTSKDVAVRTVVSKDRPRVPREKEETICSDTVGVRAIIGYRVFQHGLRLADMCNSLEDAGVSVYTDRIRNGIACA